MTTFIVDKKTINLEITDEETFGTWLQKIENILSDEGRVIHRLIVDGKILTPLDMDDIQGEKIPVFNKIEVCTSDPYTYCSQVLFEAREELDASIKKLVAATQYLSSGDIESAQSILQQVNITLRGFFSFLNSFSRIFSVDFTTYASPSGDKTVKELGEAFTAILGQVIETIQQSDFVSVSDLITYEMIDIIKDFSKLTKDLRKLMKSKQ